MFSFHVNRDWIHDCLLFVCFLTDRRFSIENVQGDQSTKNIFSILYISVEDIKYKKLDEIFKLLKIKEPLTLSISWAASPAKEIECCKMCLEY